MPERKQDRPKPESKCGIVFDAFKAQKSYEQTLKDSGLTNTQGIRAISCLLERGYLPPSTKDIVALSTNSFKPANT